MYIIRMYLLTKTLHLKLMSDILCHLIYYVIFCVLWVFFFKNLCRQGREAVQVTHELDIVSTEYVEGESVIPSGDLSRDGGIRPVEVNTILKGRLHLRVANGGAPC